MPRILIFFMRKLPGIFLLLCLAAPLIGTYTGLRFEKYRIKKEVKKRMLACLPDSNLVFFKFSNYDSKTMLRWEHAREFEYHGEMFDVVKQTVQNDSILLWCWHDHAETKLNRQLRQLVAQYQANDPCRHNKEQRLAIFFLTLFYQEAPALRNLCAHPELSILPSAVAHLLGTDVAQPPFPPPDGV